MKRIVWYPTFRCNYACPYCYEKEFPQMRERSWKDWLALFGRQDKSLIDISGGEPFLFPNFVKLVKKLSKRHSVALTTNFTRPDLLKQLKKKLYSVSLSYHPHTADWEVFLKRAKEMQKTFPDLSVNVVLYPDVLEKAPRILSDLELYGIRHHAEPYIYPNAPYSAEQMRIVSTLTGNDRQLGWQDPDENAAPVKCNAGIEQQHWLPDGSVFACGTYLMLFMLDVVKADTNYYLGNVFDSIYKERTEPIECSLPCSAGCDADYHADVWKMFGRKKK